MTRKPKVTEPSKNSAEQGKPQNIKFYAIICALLLALPVTYALAYGAGVDAGKSAENARFSGVLSDFFHKRLGGYYKTDGDKYINAVAAEALRRAPDDEIVRAGVIAEYLKDFTGSTLPDTFPGFVNYTRLFSSPDGMVINYDPSGRLQNEPVISNTIPQMVVVEQTGNCGDIGHLFKEIGRRAGLNVSIVGSPKFFFINGRWTDHEWNSILLKNGTEFYIDAYYLYRNPDGAAWIGNRSDYYGQFFYDRINRPALILKDDGTFWMCLTSTTFIFDAGVTRFINSYMVYSRRSDFHCSI